MLDRGSEWHRWDPHIHGPGTLFNDQFGAADPWDAYLTALEGLTPKVEAIGVTDYYVTDTYEACLRHKAAGRLSDVKLLFPNIEMRLDVAAKTGFVNVHLLVSPEDPDHLPEIKRILKLLQFDAFGRTFDCTRDELIRFGKFHDTTITEDRAALEAGANQAKVNFDLLRKVLRDDWARKHIRVAVSGGSGDGTAGLRQAADTVIREEIEKFAHVIFSSSPAQREFWLGKRSITEARLNERYGGCKPCLHGSDSHGDKPIGQPDLDRFCWIKGAVEFDALHQVCISPHGRAHVGERAPSSAPPSRVISHVKIDDAPWASTPEIPLNPGLVTIIGARGSGKTALADVIAAGCDAITSTAWGSGGTPSASFLARARDLIGDARTTLTWGNGTTVTRRLDGYDADHHPSATQVRYLSQQFVEELCSAKGASDGLIAEIERVIFEAHKPDERGYLLDFSELRDQRILRWQQARENEADAIDAISDRIAIENENETLVPGLKLQVEQKKTLIAAYQKDRDKLATKATPEHLARHTQLSQAAQGLRGKLQTLGNHKRTLVALGDEVTRMRSAGAREQLRQTQSRHFNSGMSAADWEKFLLDYQGDVDGSLEKYSALIDAEAKKLLGSPPSAGDPNVPLIPDTAKVADFALAPIVAEMHRLEVLFNTDADVQKHFQTLTERMAGESTALATLDRRLAEAQEASERRKALQAEREQAYERVFDAITNEQAALAELYGPLMERLADASGTLIKLSFTVRRTVDVETWGAFAEENLLDRRETGVFRGRGSLTAITRSELEPAWRSGSSEEIRKAMTAFLVKYWAEFRPHAPQPQHDSAETRVWFKQFAKWLYGTAHIGVQYELAYDGLDIRSLSPGTRGVVLLLLYLALDESDDRPLIIDQPEENLDPRSVYEELRPLFDAVKTKRQVIIVTHNANLVVNTDADQVIVAEVGSHPSGGLPPITYQAGGLESAAIRKAVCNILEGGELAFKERARRLRVHLER